MRQEYDITPVPKPRMTQRDKWKKRPCVLRYRAYKDEIRLSNMQLPEGGAHVTFVLPFPKSYSGKKCHELDGMPHKLKPDVDNLLKALLDALYEDDSCVHDIRISKKWGHHLVGKIIIEHHEWKYE